MKAQARIHLDFSSEEQLKVVIAALKPETMTPLTRRSKVQMKRGKRSLTLNFEARDTSALRAAINSYLRLASMAIDVQKLIQEKL